MDLSSAKNAPTPPLLELYHISVGVSSNVRWHWSGKMPRNPEKYKIRFTGQLAVWYLTPAIKSQQDYNPWSSFIPASDSLSYFGNINIFEDWVIKMLSNFDGSTHPIYGQLNKQGLTSFWSPSPPTYIQNFLPCNLLTVCATYNAANHY